MDFQAHTRSMLRPLSCFQEEAVAECASQLRGLSSTLDVMDLRPELGGSRWRQEIHRLEAAASGLSTRRSLLEAWGLILQANYQLEHTDSGKGAPSHDFKQIETEQKNAFRQCKK